MDGVSLEKKKCFYGHLMRYETEYASPERGSQVGGINRQGYQQIYHQGGPVYNIDYVRSKAPAYNRQAVETRYPNKREWEQRTKE